MPTFTVSLLGGWSQIPAEQGGRQLAAGDLVMLIVRGPAQPITGPAGWVQATSNAWYRIISDPWTEAPPTFRASRPTWWQVRGWAVASTDLALVSQARTMHAQGSGVQWR